MSVTFQYGVHPKFGGCLITRSPYNEVFVREVKAKIPARDRVWWKEDLTWMFNPCRAEVVTGICLQAFGPSSILRNDRMFPQYASDKFLMTCRFADLPPWLGGRNMVRVEEPVESVDFEIEIANPGGRLISF